MAPACGEKDDTTAGETGDTKALTSSGDGGATVQTAASMSEPLTDGGTTAGDTGEPTSGESTADPTGVVALDCATYCSTITANCTGERTQYGNDPFCQAACAAFPAGTLDDMAGNTLGCRIYHAGAAQADPTVHCVHAGPGGAGACGTNCEGFCAIAMSATACPDAWPDNAACLAACGTFDDSEPYDATDLGGNTLACRLYHATAAAVDPVTHCPHVKGDSMPCM